MSGIRWKRKVVGKRPMKFKAVRIMKWDVFDKEMEWHFARNQHKKRKAWKRYMRAMGQDGV